MRTTESFPLAYIGLGQMGAGMAAILAQSKVPLLVYDIDPNAIASLEKFGAIKAEDIETIQTQCELVFICLPGEQEVEAVLFGDHGLLSKPGRIKTIIDTSTLSFTKAREYAIQLREMGINYCDCPVSGLPRRSWNGTLTMMFGGSDEQLAMVKPYLDMMGEQILHCGGIGSGQMTKAINNIIYNINITGFCEVLPLAVKAGLDPELLEKLVLAGSSRSFASEHFVPRILDGKFDDDFPMQKAYKDILNVRDMASTFQVETPLVDAMTSTYRSTMNSGFGMEPKSAMIKIYEQQFGVTVRRPDPGKSGSG